MKISSYALIFTILLSTYTLIYATEVDNRSNYRSSTSDNSTTSDISAISDNSAEVKPTYETIIDNASGYECVVIPIGNKKVCVGIYEVSQAVWQKVMKTNPAHFKSNPMNPVENVTVTDVNNFIAKFNKSADAKYRLPRYEEWLFFAKDDIDRLNQMDSEDICTAFNLYDNSSNKLNHFGNKPFPCDDTFPYTAPVNSFHPNSFGLYNMIGNVAEWTSSLTANKGKRYVAGWSFSDSFIKTGRPDSRSFENRFGGLGFRLLLDVD